MGRGKGKAKKSTVTYHEDPPSGEEEKIPTQKRRGRPQKLFKDEEQELEKIDDEDSSENATKSPTSSEKKRKRNINTKAKTDLAKEENGGESRSNTEESTKSTGFRHIGSRRKSTPRRAAEAGVLCN